MKISHVLHMHFTSFLPVVFVSQGFSTAWVILHQGLFHSFLNEHVVLNQLMEILCVTIPGQQPRWYKGVASVLFTHVLVGNILRIYLTSLPSLFLLSISAKVYNVTAAKINTTHSQLLTALVIV